MCQGVLKYFFFISFSFAFYFSFSLLVFFYRKGPCPPFFSFPAESLAHLGLCPAAQLACQQSGTEGGVPAVDQDRAARTPRLSTSSSSSSHVGEEHRCR